MDLLGRIRDRLERVGLNHLGVVARARYDAAAPEALTTDRLHPGTRSIVVVGSGGRAHWEAFLAWIGGDPIGRLAEREHPLDDFCAETFAALAPELEGCRVVFPTFRADVRLDFMRLAALAGLGAPSELGILVGDRFGPWFGLRAAIFTPESLPETFEREAPCLACNAPCRAACPRGVVGVRPFAWRTCLDARASTCAVGCAAREACVIAPGETYAPLQRTYHHDRPAGRRALCALFGISDRRA